MPFAELDTWDLVLWVVLALVGLNLFGRVMLRFREAWLHRYHRQIEKVKEGAGSDQNRSRPPENA